MASAEHNTRPCGRYSGEEWKSTVESEGEYERRRFEQDPGGQAKNRVERDMVRRFLRRLPAPARVLDVPAGLGRFTDLILEAGHRPVSVDLNFGRVAEARRRQGQPCPALQADILHLPLADQAVEAALCFRLLHHLTPDIAGQVLRELRRVAARVYITFYSSHSFKYYKKRLRGKSVSGQYYPPSQVIAWSQAAGWTRCRHENPLAFWRILHALDLQRE
jgi:SAM-dependent methyltransferase